MTRHLGIDPLHGRFTELWQYERRAQEVAQPAKDYWGWYADGKEHIKRTQEAYAGVFLKPRCLIPGVPNTQTEIFGDIVNPVGVSPSAFHNLAHVEGELATAKGVAQSNGIYCYNYVYGTVPIEEVAKIGGVKWLHLYVHGDKEILLAAFRKAEKFGFSAVVVTADHPHDRVKNVMLPLFEKAGYTVEEHCANCTDDFNTCDSSWDMLQWFCENTKLPVVAKGIMCAEDAEEAVRRGARGVFVSGHGGRQFAFGQSTLEVLPSIVQAVGSKVNGNIFIDTAIRTGGDVIKALAFGAKAAFVGRPALHALYCGGDQGVANMIEILRYQLECNMQCAGIMQIADVKASRIVSHVSGPMKEVKESKL